MPIIALQRHIREVGRIRLGIQVPSRNGTRPAKLETFRFTSPNRAVIEATAELYGGEVKPWSNDGLAEFENVSATSEIPIALQPNGMGWDQWHEKWAKGFLVHRCDGQWDTAKDHACSCDPENRECATTSRLSVILPEVPGLGVWRMESHGWYAATELAGALEVIEATARRGVVLRANLRLEPRTLRRFDDKGKPVKLDFAVPVLDMPVSFEALAAGATGAVTEALPAEAPVALAPVRRAEPAGWAPVPATGPEPERRQTAEEQMAELEKPKAPRKNAARPIERVVTPRATCTYCNEPYGSDDGLVPNPEKGAGHSRFIHARHLSEVFSTETPASQGAAKGPGGKAGSERSAAEPARAPVTHISTAARQAEGMSNLQRGKLFALAGEVWRDPALTAGEQNELRHEKVLELCGALGSPDLESRADIDRALAVLVIDALEGLKAGRLALVGGELLEVPADA